MTKTTSSEALRSSALKNAYAVGVWGDKDFWLCIDASGSEAENKEIASAVQTFHQRRLLLNNQEGGVSAGPSDSSNSSSSSSFADTPTEELVKYLQRPLKLVWLYKVDSFAELDKYAEANPHIVFNDFGEFGEKYKEQKAAAAVAQDTVTKGKLASQQQVAAIALPTSYSLFTSKNRSTSNVAVASIFDFSVELEYAFSRRPRLNHLGMLQKERCERLYSIHGAASMRPVSQKKRGVVANEVSSAPPLKGEAGGEGNSKEVDISSSSSSSSSPLSQLELAEQSALAQLRGDCTHFYISNAALEIIHNKYRTSFQDVEALEKEAAEKEAAMKREEAGKEKALRKLRNKEEKLAKGEATATAVHVGGNKRGGRNSVTVIVDDDDDDAVVVKGDGVVGGDATKKSSSQSGSSGPTRKRGKKVAARYNTNKNSSSASATGEKKKKREMKAEEEEDHLDEDDDFDDVSVQEDDEDEDDSYADSDEDTAESDDSGADLKKKKKIASKKKAASSLTKKKKTATAPTEEEGGPPRRKKAVSVKKRLSTAGVKNSNNKRLRRRRKSSDDDDDDDDDDDSSSSEDLLDSGSSECTDDDNLHGEADSSSPYRGRGRKASATMTSRSSSSAAKKKVYQPKQRRTASRVIISGSGQLVRSVLLSGGDADKNSNNDTKQRGNQESSSSSAAASSAGSSSSSSCYSFSDFDSDADDNVPAAGSSNPRFAVNSLETLPPHLRNALSLSGSAGRLVSAEKNDLLMLPSAQRKAAQRLQHAKQVEKKRARHKELEAKAIEGRQAAETKKCKKWIADMIATEEKRKRALALAVVHHRNVVVRNKSDDEIACVTSDNTVDEKDESNSYASPTAPLSFVIAAAAPPPLKSATTVTGKKKRGTLSEEKEAQAHHHLSSLHQKGQQLLRSGVETWLEEHCGLADVIASSSPVHPNTLNTSEILLWSETHGLPLTGDIRPYNLCEWKERPRSDNDGANTNDARHLLTRSVRLLAVPHLPTAMENSARRNNESDNMNYNAKVDRLLLAHHLALEEIDSEGKQSDDEEEEIRDYEEEERTAKRSTRSEKGKGENGTKLVMRVASVPSYPLLLAKATSDAEANANDGGQQHTPLGKPSSSSSFFRVSQSDMAYLERCMTIMNARLATAAYRLNDRQQQQQNKNSSSTSFGEFVSDLSSFTEGGGIGGAKKGGGTLTGQKRLREWAQKSIEASPMIVASGLVTTGMPSANGESSATVHTADSVGQNSEGVDDCDDDDHTADQRASGGSILLCSQIEGEEEVEEDEEQSPFRRAEGSFQLTTSEEDLLAAQRDLLLCVLEATGKTMPFDA